MVRSRKMQFMGYVMDSQTEWERAVYLYDLAQHGIISDLQMDKTCLKVCLVVGIRLPKHPLRPRGAKLADISYTPDFAYTFQDTRIVEDVKAKYGNTAKNRAKGIAGKAIVTPASRIRIRLYQIQHPDIIFRVCTYPTTAPNDIASYEYF